MSAIDIRDLGLKLPPRERASLARDLITSLDGLDESFDAEWAIEAESRAEAYAAGQVGADDWKASLARARMSVRQDEHF